MRRLFSRLSLLLTTLIFIEALSPTFDRFPLIVVSIFCVAWSIIFFVLVVLAIPFLSSRNFKPAPLRLFADVLISITLNIVSFGLIYRYFGIEPEGAELDHYYFSAVTFSTWGFGDFAPNPNARFFAGLQAILGNLHLGIIFGAMFLAAQTLPLEQNARQNTTDKDQDG